MTTYLILSQKAFVFFGECVVFLGLRIHCYCNTQSKNWQLIICFLCTMFEPLVVALPFRSSSIFCSNPHGNLIPCKDGQVAFLYVCELGIFFMYDVMWMARLGW
jgi:hypothetical protein